MGLFDGFEGYRTPTDADYLHVLTDGMVVPDTNVLLNLYRYTTQSRADLLAVLGRLDGRLWVPHQVMLEFWRNRESVLQDPHKTGQNTLDALEKHRKQAADALREWSARTALARERLKELLNLLDEGITPVIDAVADVISTEAVDQTHNTAEDSVLKELEPLLTGRVGRPFDAAKHKECVIEGERRNASGEPPGFKDKKKDPERAVGDYLLWAQILQEAQRRKCDVLLVTGDVKDDWWRRENGQTRGPRVELSQELRRHAGVGLFMLTPENLLRRAEIALNVAINPDSAEDVERVDRSLLGDEPGAWTAEGVNILMTRLGDSAQAQYDAILFAASNDGFVSREKVYELAGYDVQGRTLKGFTRPPNRIAQSLRDRGVVPEDAVDVIEAVYDPAISYVQASGFRIPQELVRLIKQWARDVDSD